MKVLKVLRVIGPGRRTVESQSLETESAGLCPAASCARCGYEFLPYTVSAVCPRCLESFSRDPCYGGCFSCPLLPATADSSTK